MCRIFLLFLSFLLFSCKVDEKDLHNSMWKIYKTNSKDFGDVMNFDKMKVRNDTIFFQNEPIYQIIQYKNRYFLDEFIMIKSLKSQNIATYIKK